jgi:S-adenosylmethionine uptake transporter
MSTLSSTAPLMTIALAGPLLGERVSRTAVFGAVIGFGGVVVMVGIDPANVQLAMLLPLANAAILALFYLLTRDLRAEPASVTMFWSGIIPLAASTLLLVTVTGDRAPTPTEWLGIATVGVLALGAHRLLVGAYRWGRASDLAPMGYLGVLWAFIVGALVFSEPLSAQGVLGALAIATGGIIALRATSATDATDEERPTTSDVAIPVVDAG